MTIHPLFTVHTLRLFYVFSDVLDFIEAECSIYQNVQYFIRSKNLLWVLPQLDILCTSAVKRYYAKNDNSPFKCHLFSRVLEFMEARKTCNRVPRTSVWSIPYSGELCNKNCIVKTSETLIFWSASCYTAGSVKWDAIKGVPRWLLKRAVMVFRVHNRTYWIDVDLLMLTVSNGC